MKQQQYIFVLATVAALLSGCKEDLLEKNDVEVVDLRRSEAELQVPKKLWAFIEGTVEATTSHEESHDKGKEKHEEVKEAKAEEPAEGGGKEGGEGGPTTPPGGAGLILSNNMEFAGVEMFLSERSGRPLGGKNYKFEFAKGGGNLDLAQYIKEEKGDFWMSLEVPGSLIHKDMKVFFISGGKTQKLGVDSYGLGCGKIAEITDFYKKNLSSQGVVITNKHGVHVSQVVGSYIIMYETLEGLWRVAQVTLTDSSQKSLLCRGT